MVTFARLGAALLVGVSTAWGWQQKLPVGDPEATAILTASGDVAVARCAGTGEPLRRRLVVAMLRGNTGVQRWQKTIPRADYCFAPNLIADDAGDLYVAAALTSFEPTRGAVVKLAGSDGREVWRHETAAVPRGRRLIRRPDSSIVVSDDHVTTALDAETGAERWSVDYEGTLSLLASDAAGDLFAVLIPPFPPDPGDIIVLKLDGASGGEHWRRVLDGTAVGGGGGDISWDVAADLAVDDAGDVIVVGWLTNAHPHDSGASFDEDAIVAKLAGASGEEQWRTLFVGTKGGDDRAGLVTIASGGDPVVGVQLDGRARVIRLLGGSGDVTWESVWGIGGDTEEYVQRIAIDAAGDVLELGKYATNREAVAKLSGATGDEQWLQTFIARRPSHDPYGDDVTLDGEALALGARGEIVLTGTSVRFTGGGTVGATTAIKLSSSVAGKRLVIRDDGAIRKLTLVMRDPHITPALPAGPGDPSISGALLVLSSLVTGDHTTLTLPAAGWSKRAEGGFEYRGSAGAQACPEVIFAAGSLTARCSTDDTGLQLDGPLGSVDVTFTLGEPGFPYCASFGGTVKQDRPVSADAPGLFRAIDASPPESCG